MSGKRTERLQILLEVEEMTALDDWRFAHRVPTRGAAVRELMRLGLNGKAEDLLAQRANGGTAASRDYGVLQSPDDLAS